MDDRLEKEDLILELGEGARGRVADSGEVSSEESAAYEGDGKISSLHRVDHGRRAAHQHLVPDAMLIRPLSSSRHVLLDHLLSDKTGSMGPSSGRIVEGVLFVSTLFSVNGH